MIVVVETEQVYNVGGFSFFLCIVESCRRIGSFIGLCVEWDSTRVIFYAMIVF